MSVAIPETVHVDTIKQSGGLARSVHTTFKNNERVVSSPSHVTTYYSPTTRSPRTYSNYKPPLATWTELPTTLQTPAYLQSPAYFWRRGALLIISPRPAPLSAVVTTYYRLTILQITAAPPYDPLFTSRI